MNGEHSPPLVLIEWLDSGQPVPSWQWLEHIAPRRPHLCVSMGFLMHDGDDAKVLAPNLGASNGCSDWDQASGVITIPTAAVRRLLRLESAGTPPVMAPSAVDCDVAPGATLLRAS